MTQQSTAETSSVGGQTPVEGVEIEQKTDLVCELPGVAYDQSSHLLVHRLKLLEDGKHEDSSLPHPRLGLTDHIHAKDGLWDTLMLHCASTRSSSV